jgi:hypothetical protein
MVAGIGRSDRFTDLALGGSVGNGYGGIIRFKLKAHGLEVGEGGPSRGVGGF